MKMRLFGVVLTILAGYAQASAALFTTNTFLGSADLTYENQPVIVSGCELTLEGVHTFQSLQLTNAAVLRHVAAPNGQANRQVNLSVTGSLTVDGTSRVSADGLGFAAGSGPGAGNSSSTNWGTGAGHGGLGGMGSGTMAGGSDYGSPANPTQHGSGGGDGYLSSGGSGGGVIRISVAGNALINGNLTANGTAGWGSTLAGGGSGGSIYLSAGQLTGFGILAAIGGAASTGGGGAGGRITVVCSNYDFRGRYWAYGGEGKEKGGAGTIYFQTSSIPQMILDNGGTAGAMTPLQPMPGVNLAIGNFAVAYPVTSVSNANVIIRSNGCLTHLPGQATLSISVATNLVVELGGRIDVSGKGYASSTGPGAGVNADLGPTVTAGGGGGHGGCGGGDQMGGVGHDSLLRPKEYGSGGGNGFLSYGGYGGGCVDMRAGGTVRIDGALLAVGGDTFGYILGGGGAGGSVNLDMATLSGSGEISANGGNGIAGAGGGGGGGRIAAYFRTNLFAGKITALGGAGGIKGGAGTVYYQAAAAPHGRLVVDNGGVPGGVTQLNPEFWPGISFFDLTLSGSAWLLAETPLTFGDVLVTSGATITHPAGTRTLQLVALGDAVFAAGTRVSADGLGFMPGNGPGPGGTSGNWEGGGGGYGGLGGGTTNGAPGGIVYGSPSQPLDFGSGGGAGYLSSGGGGGGLIQLSAARILQLDGEVTANGSPAPNLKGGGGAGGSIFLTAGILTGSGLVSARGGAAVLGGGGGGGRIALYGGLIVDFPTPPSVAGGLSGSGARTEANGKVGTIYKSTNFPPFQVVGMSPTNFVPQPVASVRIAFNTGIDSNSIAAANVSVQTPTGLLPANQVSITPAGGPWFTIGFPVQTAAGTYTLKLGPGIKNLQGELMDQNGNGVRGEPSLDAFSGTFRLGPSVTISGTVRLASNVPVANVRIQAGSDAVATTDASGQYALILPQNWSGTVTPSKLGTTLLPVSRTYANLNFSQSAQDYTVTLIFAPTLRTALQSSTLRLEWLSVPGIRYQIRTASNLTDWEDAGLPLLGTGGVLYWAIDTAGNPRTFVRVLANN